MSELKPRCPFCLSSSVRRVAMKYHFLCGYIGPEYDFSINQGLCRCPKCKMILETENYDWEYQGLSYICDDCDEEFVNAV